MSKIFAILVILLVIALVVRFFVCKYFYKCILFNDILKEKSQDGDWKYSQGRVYLLLSLLAYFVTIGILTSKALKPNIGIDGNAVRQIIEALQWVVMLMAGYVFGGKGLELVKLFLNNKNGGGNNNQQQQQ